MTLRRRVAVGLSALSVMVSALAGVGSAAVAVSAADPAMAPVSPNVVSILAGEGSCPQFRFCIWWATNFGRDGNGLHTGLAIGGDFLACQGVNWQQTSFENHAFSIKNNTTGKFSIWNRVSGTPERYHEEFLSPPGNKGNIDRAGGTRADALAYDPLGGSTLDCANPNIVLRLQR